MNSILQMKKKLRNQEVKSLTKGCTINKEQGWDLHVGIYLAYFFKGSALFCVYKNLYPGVKHTMCLVTIS